MSEQRYGSYSDSDLDHWEKLPTIAPVLTSSAMGAWLMRRDKNKGDVSNEIIRKMKAEINNLTAPKTDTEYQDGFYDCETMALDVIDKYCKGDNNA